jgi:hypothetical protein
MRKARSKQKRPLLLADLEQYRETSNFSLSVGSLKIKAAS